MLADDTDAGRAYRLISSQLSVVSCQWAGVNGNHKLTTDNRLLTTDHEKHHQLELRTGLMAMGCTLHSDNDFYLCLAKGMV